jgi:hypothetical protein
MEVPLSNRTIKSPLLGTLAIVLPAVILALAVSVGPSFAGSFLTHREAVQTFVKKADVRPAPSSRIIQSTADVGPLSSTTPYGIPAARAVFKTNTETSDVVITFSGQATCTGATAGAGCPIQILVDGYATGKVNFLTASSTSPAPKEDVHTVVQSAIVTPGQHVISVRYAGSTDPSVGFKVLDFNLIVQAYPTGPVVVEEE